MLSQKLTALNIQDLQYDFRAPKTLVRRGNYAANCGIVGCDADAKHYPCPDFLTLTRLVVLVWNCEATLGQCHLRQRIVQRCAHAPASRA